MAVIPPLPSNVQIQQANGQVLLTWNTVAGASLGYPVQRSTDNATWTTLATPLVTSYVDTTATTGTLYYYQVASKNSAGTSAYSSSVSITPTQSGFMSLGQLRLLAQQRADMVNSNYITTAEWNDNIRQSHYELYDILINSFEEYALQGPVLFTTDGSNNLYPLPDGISSSFTDATGATITPPPVYKLAGVDCGLALNNNAWVTLHKFNFISRNRYVYPNITSSFLGVFNLRYRLEGNNIMFIPTPSAGQYIRIWYVPRLTEMLKDSDQCDGVSGWTEYIIIDAAIKAWQKQEWDVSVLMAQKQAILDRIQAAAQNRDAGAPDTISDIRSYNGSFGDYGAPGGDGAYGGWALAAGLIGTMLLLHLHLIPLMIGAFLA